MTASTDLSTRGWTSTGAPFRFALLLAGAAMTSGCTSLSFAPPRVEVDRRIASPDPSKCAQLAPANAALLQHSVPGGIDLIDNFVRAYRCAAHEAADGRQTFEVPSFLALAAAGLGPAFGMSEDAGLALGGAAAVGGHANSYYAPKQKAAVLDAALGAALCVKTEAVGVDFFDTRRDPDPVTQKAIVATQAVVDTLNGSLQVLTTERTQAQAQLDGAVSAMQLAPTADAREAASARHQQQQLRVEQINTTIDRTTQAMSDATNALAQLRIRELSSTANPINISKAMPDGSVVEVSVAEQYFQMISAALLSIDRILAQRLSNTGNFDSAGLTSELSTLIKARDDAKKALDDAKKPPAAGVAAMAMGLDEKQTNEKVVELSIDLLQPALQKCVVLAKL